MPARRGHRRRPTARRLLRGAVRALTDWPAWRIAGREEFAFSTEALRSLRAIGAMRVTVASLAIMMLPLAVVSELNPMGPNTPLKTAVHLAMALGGLALGVYWLVRPWPTARGAIWFLAISDALLGVGGSLMSDPTARICAMIHLGMLGMFAAFLLGWRILLLHCAYALLVIGGMTAYAITFEGRSLMDLYVYTTPAITTVVGLPVVVQVVVELGRRGTTRVATEWYVDVLTGVFNRRGMEVAVRRAVTRRTTESSLYVVATLDLDGFKKYNDTHGHFAGDELLETVALRLREAVPASLIARNGGDEFGVFAVRDDPAAAAATVEALRSLVRPRGAGPGDGRIAGSVGVVVSRACGRDRLQEQAALADDALYEAKRSASSAVVVRDRTRRDADVTDGLTG